MISNPRASDPARRSGRLSDPQGSRPVTVFAADQAGTFQDVYVFH
jgi:hypothetical protein